MRRIILQVATRNSNTLGRVGSNSGGWEEVVIRARSSKRLPVMWRNGCEETKIFPYDVVTGIYHYNDLTCCSLKTGTLIASATMTIDLFWGKFTNF